jgi:hypothetical protein
MKKRQTKKSKLPYVQPPILFLARDIQSEMERILVKFNIQKIRLFDLPAYKRIFLFILTRACKTFDAIIILCKNGFGQDAAILLRGLFESYVTAKYIVSHPQPVANQLAARFVDYKWIILKKHLYETGKKNQRSTAPEDEEYRKQVLERVDDFKKKYGIMSDRGLLSWSGKTLRDMAGKIGPELLNEYETIFRICSRFSHPGILGDNEYLVTDQKHLIFSPLPSQIGVRDNLLHASYLMVGLLRLTDILFGFKDEKSINAIESKVINFRSQKSSVTHPAKSKSSPNSVSIRDSIIQFEITELL